ncbi:LacI family DNA-binding transcriptional regulator [uncultured Cohaesibacter sp.]|uniref:LacI family DNA-binding transcriptional regulator n=1 Tax=uncultured Cohaesibacter sp. TaxID=1002546 RepID=UPI003747E8E9
MSQTTRPKSGFASGTVSISAVAKRAGVSISTVSRVVNGVKNKVSAENAERVQKAIRELGYRPSRAGQALRKRSSKLVAVIAANLSNPAMSAVAASAEMALREAGYVMVLCDSHDRADLQDEYLLEMKAQLVSAFVLLGAVSSPVLDEFVEAGETVIFVNRRNPSDRPAPFIGIDNDGAARQISDLLQSWHCKKALVIHGQTESSAVKERLASFRKAFVNHWEGSEVIVRGSDSPDHLNIGYNEMNRWLEGEAKLPDAVFCLSDLIAFGAGRALREKGYDLETDCRLIGFDDNPLNDWVAPWLSSMRVPYEEFGIAIVDMLKPQQDEEPRTETLLGHDLVVRPRAGIA